MEHSLRGSSRAVAVPRRAVSLVRRNGPLVVLDVAVVLAAYLVSISIRFQGKVPSHYWLGFWRLSALLVATHLLANHRFGLYGAMWRYASIHEARRLLLAGGVSLVLVLVIGRLAMLAGLPRPSTSVLALGAILSTFGFGAIRFQSRLFAFRRASQRAPSSDVEGRAPRTRVLIMGAGEAGAKVIRDLQMDRSLGIDPVAIVDDAPRLIGRSIHGVPVLGSRDDIPGLAAELDVDQVLLAIPSITSGVVQRVAELCEHAELSLRILPALSELVGGQVSARDLRTPSIEDILGRQQIQLDLAAVSHLLHERRVLITGAGGSIGSEIARQVSTFSPTSLVLLDNDETHLHDAMMTLDRPATACLADVRDRLGIVDLFLRHAPQVVFHAAAHKHVPILEDFPNEAFQTNVLGTSNVVDATLLCGADRFVLISTDKAVQPASVMGGSKRLAEDLVRTQQGRGPLLSAVRFGNVLASRGSVVPTFLRQIEAGGPVTVTDPDMTRYFMSIREAVGLVLQAASLAEGGEVFTLDMGEPVNILDLARRMIRLSGRVPYRDVPIVIVGARPGEKLHERLDDPGEPKVVSAHPSIAVSRPRVPDPATMRGVLTDLQSLAREGRTPELAERLRAAGPGPAARPDGPRETEPTRASVSILDATLAS